MSIFDFSKKPLKTGAGNLLTKGRATLADALWSFRRNNDMTAASSLAFSATLALIPALFLLTVLLGAAIGSSARAFQKTQEFVMQLIPAYSQVVLSEVRFIAGHKGAIGLVNFIVLLWSITPLVADLRVSLGTIFRKKLSRPFLLEKLWDVSIGIVFLLGLAALSVAGIAITLLERIRPLRLAPGYVEEFFFFVIAAVVVSAVYFTFAGRRPVRHLLTGAITALLLWFALKPAFHAFLSYNPGYGFAFGSFKSLFVVVIWIYISLVLFLFGAEIAASLGRNETIYIKHLLEGRKNVPDAVMSRYVANYEKGSVIFRDGEPGTEMFAVIKGSVSIQKDEKEVAVIGPGRSFGGLSFLLMSPRVATAVALEDLTLVVLNSENVSNLMDEFPEFIVEMLGEMTARLRDTNRVAD